MKFLLVASICIMLGGCITLPFGIAKYFEYNYANNKIEKERVIEKKRKMDRKRKEILSTARWNSYVQLSWVRHFFQ